MNNNAPEKYGTILFAISCVFLFAYPFLFLPFGPDQGIFAYIGTMINNGGMPYVDAWDLKPPLIYYLYSLPLKLRADSMLGLKLFDFIYFMVTLLAVYGLGQYLFDRSTGLSSAVALGGVYFFTNDFFALSQCESFMILPMIFSVYCCCSGVRNRNMPLLVLSGLAAGAAMLLKTVGIMVLVPNVLFLTCEVYRQEGCFPAGKMLVRVLMLAAGVLVLPGIVAAWFFARGGLDEMLYTLVTYDAAHFASALHFNKDYPHMGIAGCLRRYLFVLLPALASLPVNRLRAKGPEYVMLYSWALVAGLAFVVQQRFYPYHLLPVIAPLAILGGQGMMCIWSDLWWGKRALFLSRKTLLSVLVVLLFFAAARNHVRLSYKFTRAMIGGSLEPASADHCFTSANLNFSVGKSRKIAAYIQNNTGEHDPVYIWGFASLIYFFSQRQSPTRFFFNAPLVAPFNERREAWRREALADLQASPPAYIVVVEQDNLQNRLMSNIDADSLSLLRQFRGLSAMMEKDYMLEKKIDNFRLYRHANE